MPRPSIFTSRRGATSLALSPYASFPTIFIGTTLRRLTRCIDGMADQAPTRLVQAPSAHQLLDARRNLFL